MIKINMLLLFISAILVFMMAFTAIQSVSSKAESTTDKTSRIPDVLIVQLKTTYTLEFDPIGAPGQRFKTESSALKAELERLDVQSVKPLLPPGQIHKIEGSDDSGLTGTYLISFKKSTDIDAAREVLASIDDIEFVEPNYLVTVQDTIPNDPHYTEQWALPAIGAPSAWAELPADAPKVIVAVTVAFAAATLT